MSEYKTLGHGKFKIKYHLIFSTKYRRRCLEEIHDSLLVSLKRAEKLQDDWSIDLVETDKDHIHLLVSSTPGVSPYEIIHKLKQVSTFDMWKSHYEYLRKFYWKQHHLWTRGYFCASVGMVSEETIRRYIENQG